MQSMQNLKRGINKMKKKLLEILAEVCDEDALAETDDMDIDLVAEDLIELRRAPCSHRRKLWNSHSSV